MSDNHGDGVGALESNGLDEAATKDGVECLSENATGGGPHKSLFGNSVACLQATDTNGEKESGAGGAEGGGGIVEPTKGSDEVETVPEPEEAEENHKTDLTLSSKLIINESILSDDDEKLKSEEEEQPKENESAGELPVNEEAEKKKEEEELENEEFITGESVILDINHSSVISSNCSGDREACDSVRTLDSDFDDNWDMEEMLDMEGRLDLMKSSEAVKTSDIDRKPGEDVISNKDDISDKAETSDKLESASSVDEDVECFAAVDGQFQLVSIVSEDEDDCRPLLMKARKRLFTLIASVLTAYYPNKIRIETLRVAFQCHWELDAALVANKCGFESFEYMLLSNDMKEFVEWDVNENDEQVYGVKNHPAISHILEGFMQFGHNKQRMEEKKLKARQFAYQKHTRSEAYVEGKRRIIGLMKELNGGNEDVDYQKLARLYGKRYGAILNEAELMRMFLLKKASKVIEKVFREQIYIVSQNPFLLMLSSDDVEADLETDRYLGDIGEEARFSAANAGDQTAIGDTKPYLGADGGRCQDVYRTNGTPLNGTRERDSSRTKNSYLSRIPIRSMPSSQINDPEEDERRSYAACGGRPICREVQTSFRRRQETGRMQDAYHSQPPINEFQSYPHDSSGLQPQPPGLNTCCLKHLEEVKKMEYGTASGQPPLWNTPYTCDELSNAQMRSLPQYSSHNATPHVTDFSFEDDDMYGIHGRRNLFHGTDTRYPRRDTFQKVLTLPHDSYAARRTVPARNQGDMHWNERYPYQYTPKSRDHQTRSYNTADASHNSSRQPPNHYASSRHLSRSCVNRNQDVQRGEEHHYQTDSGRHNWLNRTVPDGLEHAAHPQYQGRTRMSTRHARQVFSNATETTDRFPRRDEERTRHVCSSDESEPSYRGNF